QLRLEDLQHPVDARLPERAEPPQHRAPDPHAPGAQRERLEHVRTATHAAVQENGDAVADDGHHLRERLERAAPRFRRASPVVGDEYAVEAVLQAKLGVLAGIYALENELALPVVAQPLDEAPVHGGVGSALATHIDALRQGTMPAVLEAARVAG